MSTNGFNTINEALADLKQGKIIIVCDDEKRENEGDFVVLAEFATPEAINFMITHGRGLVCMPLSPEYIKRLNLTPMVSHNSDNFNTAFTVSIDHKSTTTGISAFDRANTISKILDDDTRSSDFKYPGHIFPLEAKVHGVLQRAGHTEAAVDLARLCNSKPAGVICEVIKADGSMAKRDDLKLIAKEFDLKIITIEELIHYRKCIDKLIVREAQAELPTKFGNFTICGYTSITDKYEHIALVKDDAAVRNDKAKIPLVRIHSKCMTGDIFHSLRCDCGEQLELSLKAIEKYGYGALIYLHQEGRGIGLINKLRAYNLQQQGLDTVQANLALGFAADLREYFLAAQILRDLGMNEVRLITNNPSKIKELENYGIKIHERVGIKSTAYAHNLSYLNTKKNKLGHFYERVEDDTRR